VDGGSGMKVCGEKVGKVLRQKIARKAKTIHYGIEKLGCVARRLIHLRRINMGNGGK